MDTLHEGCWSPKKLVGTMIDNFMSYTDLRNLRQALSLKYDPDMDRFMHPIWMMSPFDELLHFFSHFSARSRSISQNLSSDFLSLST